MKLDTRHLAGALALLASSVVYNVWALAEPRATGEPAAAVLAPAPPPLETPAAGDRRAAHAQPSQPAVEVMLDSPPEWTRDPFDGGAEQPAIDVAALEPPSVAPPDDPPVSEPDLAVTSVLYSSSRKLAIVNGRTVAVGDTVDGATVVDILPSAIVVRSPGGTVRTIERLTPRLAGERR